MLDEIDNLRAMNTVMKRQGSPLRKAIRVMKRKNELTEAWTRDIYEDIEEMDEETIPQLELKNERLQCLNKDWQAYNQQYQMAMALQQISNTATKSQAAPTKKVLTKPVTPYATMSPIQKTMVMARSA